MGRIEITDEWLEKYMPMASDMMLQQLEENMEEENYDFSPEFEKKMERLIKKESRGLLGGAGKFMGKVAVALVCVLGISLAVTMSVDAYRTKFFQTAQELWKDSVIHTYFSGDEDQSFVPQEPAYVPEGYVEVSRGQTEVVFSIEYVDEYGKELYWDQRLAMDDAWSILDADYKKQEQVKIDNGVLIVSTYEDGYMLIYYEHEQYIFVLSGYNIEINNIIPMFESIK